MKHIFFIFSAFIFSSFQLMSQGNLIFFSEEGNPMYLIIDGVKYNEAAQTNVKVTGLAPGQHQARVFFSDESLGKVDKKVWVEDFMEITYAIKKKEQSNVSKKIGDQGNRLYKNFTLTDEEIADTDKDDWFVMRIFNKTSLSVPPPPVAAPAPQNAPAPAPHTTTTVVTHQAPPPTGESINVNINVQEDGASFGMNVSTGTQSSTTTYTEQTTTTYQELPPSPPQRCSYPMDNGSYQAAYNSVQSNGFEDTKLTVAKQVCQANCLTATQIAGIMGIFSFEDSKLDFAKFAYPLSFDPNNYYLVNSAFDFESSIEELNNYIQRMR